MLLEIAQYGNPVLKEKCRPVEHFDDSLKTLAENMLETCLLYTSPSPRDCS